MIKNIFIILSLFIFSCKDAEKQNVNQPLAGCTDSLASIDDENCDYSGCTDLSAGNFDSKATIDDGNCISDDDIPEGYVYYWNDEFNGNSLNLNYWNIEVMPEGSVNNEAQSYTESPENVYVSNGNLIIRAKKENPFNPSDPKYTSGRVTTKDKLGIQYGYIEVRAKLPSGVGSWPAIWMLGSDIDSVGWPKCGEIDIMEHVGHDPNHIHFSLHNNTLWGDVSGTDQQGVFYSQEIENQYNTYAVDWDSTQIKGYLNNQEYFQFTKSEFMEYEEWPYDLPFFLIINLAIGGNWGGQQGIDNSIFPCKYLIDYVRVFKKIRDYDA